MLIMRFDYLYIKFEEFRRQSANIYGNGLCHFWTGAKERILWQLDEINRFEVKRSGIILACWMVFDAVFKTRLVWLAFFKLTSHTTRTNRHTSYSAHMPNYWLCWYSFVVGGVVVWYDRNSTWAYLLLPLQYVYKQSEWAVELSSMGRYEQMWVPNNTKFDVENNGNHCRYWTDSKQQTNVTKCFSIRTIFFSLCAETTNIPFWMVIDSLF